MATEIFDLSIRVDADWQALETAVSVAIETTVYSLIKGDNLLILFPVGRVPIGTLCDPSQSFTKDNRTYNVVPISAVTLTGSAHPVVALARCS